MKTRGYWACLKEGTFEQLRRRQGSASMVGYWEGAGREHVGVITVGPQWNDGRRRKGVRAMADCLKEGAFERQEHREEAAG